ncbi:MAG: glycosyltransferase family 39 protein [Planctomycetota bacterium]
MPVSPLRCRAVVAILLVALVPRLISLVRNPLIGADSYRFLQSAERFEEGDYRGMLDDSYHPLTASIIGTLNQFQNLLLPHPQGLRQEQERRERAAHLVILLAGLLVVLLLMDLTWRLFPGISPLAVGLLAAINPYFVRSSADIMSDTLFLVFFLLALRESAIIPRRMVWLRAMTAGAAVGLAYLARPEGLVLLPAVGFFWVQQSPRRIRFLASRLIPFAAAATLLILPYADAIGSLTHKKSILEMMGEVFQNHIPTTMNKGFFSWLDVESIGRLLHRWFEAGPEVISVAALVGLVFAICRKEWGPGHTLFAEVIGIMLMLLALLVAMEGDGYLSKRHMFTLVALSLPMASRGLLGMGAGLSHVLRLRFRNAKYLLLVLAMVAMTPKAISAHRQDQIAQRQAAEFILENGDVGQVIYTNREKVAYYSGGAYQTLDQKTEDTLQRILRQERAWLVFYREKMERYSPGFSELVEKKAAEEPHFRHMKTILERYDEPPRHLVIYLWEHSGASQSRPQESQEKQ